MSKKYQAAIIGHTGKGDFGHDLDKIFKGLPEVETIVIIDLNPHGLERKEKNFPDANFYTKIEDAFTNHDINLLAICQRDVSLRINIFRACSGKSVKGIICEKPLASNTKEAREIIEICNHSNIDLAVAHRRANPYESYAKKMIDEGRIGEIITIKSRGKCDHRSGGEDLAVLGIHMMDSMRYMAGCEVQSVYAKILEKKKEIKRNDVRQGKEGIGLIAGDSIFANYLFENGVMGMFESYPIKTTIQKHSSFFGFEVYGTKGIVCVRNSPIGEMYLLEDCVWMADESEKKWQKIKIKEWDNIPLNERTISSNKIIVNALLKKIESGVSDPNVSWGFDALQATEMIGATIQSATTKKEVNLPLNELENPYLHW